MHYQEHLCTSTQPSAGLWNHFGILCRPAVQSPHPHTSLAPQIPKTTRLSLQQAQREREQGVAMHRSFQRDLVKMRLAAARAYVKVLTDGQVRGTHSGWLVCKALLLAISNSAVALATAQLTSYGSML